VALLAVAVGGEGGCADGVAGAAGCVRGFGYSVVRLLVIDWFARLGEDFGVAGFALAFYALVVFAVGKGHIAVLCNKDYGLGWDAGW
jgi:hypothetical protein